MEKAAGRRQDTPGLRRSSREVLSGHAWQALRSFSSSRRHVDDGDAKLSCRSSPRLLTSLIKSHGVWGYFFGWPHRTFLIGQMKDSVTQLDRLGRFGWLLSPTRRRSSCDVSSFPYSDPTSNAARRVILVILGWSDVGSVLDIAHMIFETGGAHLHAAPISTVRAELSVFWAFGAAGFWSTPWISPDRMAESEIFETPSCPEKSNRSRVHVSSPYKQDTTASSLLVHEPNCNVVFR